MIMLKPTHSALLVELVTEELPPKALRKLGNAFAAGIQQGLDTRGLLMPDCRVQAYATPRRLAVHLSAVRRQAPHQDYVEKLMPVQIGLDRDNQPTPALHKKLAAKGLQHVDIARLSRESDGKQEYLVARGSAPGARLLESLQDTLDTTLANLPIPKVMNYQLADGVTTVKFVRPAHGLVALFGADVLAVSALGLQADRVTQGHRFMGPKTLQIDDADAYVSTLYERGYVIADFDTRHNEISRQLNAHAQALGSTLGDDPEVAALLEEVTALVEHPNVYVGEFEPRFLAVPPECLILTMRRDQRYFPLFAIETGKLTHRFLIVSNMQRDEPTQIIEGNQRVIRPRLADAQFFFEADRQTPLSARVEPLGQSVYHHQLGSQLARVQRLQVIARGVALSLGLEASIEATIADQAARAAQLAKADLNTNMVGEFPELQGIMGACYAQAEGEAAEIVVALRQQYRHRLETAVDASTLVMAILFIAERAETLMGIWSIGLAPTGERDPYALRRAALGLISAFEQLAAGGWLQGHNDLLPTLLRLSADSFTPPINARVQADVQAFIYERYRHQLASDFERDAIDAVIACTPPLHQVAARVRAVTLFCALPEAASLAAANKRIGNLLKKSADAPVPLNIANLVAPAERALADAMETLRPRAHAQFEAGDFAASLSTLAHVRKPVDTFFNEVRIMTDDVAVRTNRLALLGQLHDLMNQVADISKLA